MNVKIKRIDKSLPLPVYETKGAVGFDILARESTTIDPKSVKLIPGNVVVQIPKGYMLMLTLRSSTPKKKGLLKPHGVGIIDNDYCGNEDELKIQVYNFNETASVIEKGEKIAQGIFVRVDTFSWEEVDDMNNKTRGGFGSTDK
ncbi:MAG: dUTP diphosphatase [Candidatus Nanoarchaeia archaeon]|nr:dUTP diphosphatase [Candidatus Nanoarchaeia archaeon]